MTSISKDPEKAKEIMTSKEKILKDSPTAYAQESHNGFRILKFVNEDLTIALTNYHRLERSAAVRARKR